MRIMNEYYQQIRLDIPLRVLIETLANIKSKQFEEINNIKEKINNYEQKKRAEEAFYQSLSPLRKIFTGKAPSHHQAVEYLVHVKERFKKIDRIKQQITELDLLISKLEINSNEHEIIIPNEIIDAIKLSRKMEDI